ncbi:hypothetical protein [Nonomuraea sp. SYSU D8015]|uniref:hypothetical protein n=1 Tax=Nonomuraea sp. SYSU D8015 TaxID=2593644 RepID=UPI0016603CB1|nr:hypothetical protein [Nonomuraea sp. SYSU D8015]
MESPTLQAPPHVRPAPAPAPRASERREPERRRPPAFGVRIADPCATFDDFRREACYSFLDRLTR